MNYSEYLKNRKAGTGASIGGMLGTALGVIGSPFTGGASMALGPMVGSAIGGAIDSSTASDTPEQVQQNKPIQQFGFNTPNSPIRQAVSPVSTAENTANSLQSYYAPSSYTTTQFKNGGRVYNRGGMVLIEAQNKELAQFNSPRQMQTALQVNGSKLQPLSPTVAYIGGRRHTQGGTPLNMPPGSHIVPDYDREEYLEGSEREKVRMLNSYPLNGTKAQDGASLYGPPLPTYNTPFWEQDRNWGQPPFAPQYTEPQNPYALNSQMEPTSASTLPEREWISNSQRLNTIQPNPVNTDNLRLDRNTPISDYGSGSPTTNITGGFGTGTGGTEDGGFNTKMGGAGWAGLALNAGGNILQAIQGMQPAHKTTFERLTPYSNDTQYLSKLRQIGNQDYGFTPEERAQFQQTQARTFNNALQGTQGYAPVNQRMQMTAGLLNQQNQANQQFASEDARLKNERRQQAAGALSQLNQSKFSESQYNTGLKQMENQYTQYNDQQMRAENAGRAQALMSAIGNQANTLSQLESRKDNLNYQNAYQKAMMNYIKQHGVNAQTMALISRP